MENKDMVMAAETAVTKPDYSGEIAAIIRSSDAPKTIMNKLEDYHGSDIANVVGTLSPQERKRFYRVCSADAVAEVFEFLDEADAGIFLNEMDIRKAAAIVSKLDTDTAVEILRSINKEKRSLIISMLSSDVKEEIRLIASFDEDEIGSRMTTNCIIIHENMTIKQAITS